MKAADILELDSVAFIEPSFASLTDPLYTDLLAADNGDEGRMLVDENEDPIRSRLPRKGRAGSRDRFSAGIPNVEAYRCLREGERRDSTRRTGRSGQRRYASTSPCCSKKKCRRAMEDLNPVRKGILTDAIAGVWGKGAGETCIDCGCGSGVGSLVLRELGYTPLSYDNDPGLLVLGMDKGRLLPEETMCIDATQVAAYTEPVPKAIGIMMGEINTFSSEMWHTIAAGLFAVSKETLITVGTEPETHLIAEWAKRGRAKHRDPRKYRGLSSTTAGSA